ncbi:hypothetical protein NW752_002280 [Fusarium irregulare]|uniref:Uncharacterized protein n=1 Tax=Fusarium irregulare TaxID=2494466 RepID=A0A9W8PFQ7_9HYPO|nr:hypothetical protein NW766_010995 [Fusarium irregulare]KAJ4024828.1 hypothetical protein NW752_002280 [Fusarium irregulare]
MDATELNLLDKAVYKVTREIFKDENAKIRDLKAVRKCIKNHPGDRKLVLELVAELGAGSVHKSILRLLSSHVYESPWVAVKRFPDLCEPFVALREAEAPSEEDATTAEQATLGAIVQAHGDNNEESSDSTERTAVQDVIDGIIAKNDVSKSSVFLPFPAEHMLMEKLQKILELACFQFGLRAVPNVMQEQGWDCPESAELTKWVELFGRNGNIAVWQQLGMPSQRFLQSIAAIRHTAVHRVRTNSAGLEQFLTDAERLAELLGNDAFTQAISQLRLDFHATVTELIQNKQSTQQQLDKVREGIARQRAELDQKEQEILRDMASQNKKHCDLAAERLEKVIDRMGDLSFTSDDQGAALESADAIQGQQDTVGTN